MHIACNDRHNTKIEQLPMHDILLSCDSLCLIDSFKIDIDKKGFTLTTKFKLEDDERIHTVNDKFFKFESAKIFIDKLITLN